MPDNITEPSVAPFIHRRTIRFGETDAAAIVYTARFFEYALDAIDAWYVEVVTVSLYSLNMEHNISCPFVHASIDFKSALRPGDELAVTVLVQKHGRSSLSFRVLGECSNGILSFIGTFTLVFVDAAALRSIPIPAQISARIKEYMDRCPENTALGDQSPCAEHSPSVQ
ncbi:acyl-CoA thioesterase [Eoetvoesiella caeni]|uniref:Acyl-CoA thioesterase FadM n=1 Tax=Eoetvoesiella caeni TaxID=645616 RepID=A0A366HKS5_9BURK|nr:thioesterase family protein [Eoetvoesiella caeni]MCI2807056.1 acyl-CoA thioesterase [Eoetvoesiella caeni]NYT53547.1 acyl-CoA thioesterase [Eoetvoesiella caeni]RBP43533.1 acyl-CoA thioesterase FadM [Eoetvoesiella caeni]